MYVYATQGYLPKGLSGRPGNHMQTYNAKAVYGNFQVKEYNGTVGSTNGICVWLGNIKCV